MGRQHRAGLGFRGVSAVKVGMWSADMLIKLPIFFRLYLLMVGSN